MRHRRNYDWMLFLTSPMAFTRALTPRLLLLPIISIILVYKITEYICSDLLN